MRIPRVFHASALATGTRIGLEAAAANHIARVLRLRCGAPIVLFDGSGGEYLATIVSADKRTVDVQVENFVPRDVESPLDITLVQGISRGERMDYTIQKAVELGVNRIVPVVTERSVVKLSGERAAKKIGHWQGVAISACEQSGRNRVPEIEEIRSLSEWLGASFNGTALFLDPRAEGGLGGLGPKTRVALLVGPEGGLSDAEERNAYSSGYVGLRLGPRVLRTETAGLAAVAVLQALWGDLS